MRTEVMPVDTPHDGKCESLWRRDLPCPNQAEFIIRDRSTQGFAIMCGPHAEGFLEACRGNFDVIAYTEAWVLECERAFQEKAKEARLTGDVRLRGTEGQYERNQAFS